MCYLHEVIRTILIIWRKPIVIIDGAENSTCIEKGTITKFALHNLENYSRLPRGNKKWMRIELL